MYICIYVYIYIYIYIYICIWKAGPMELVVQLAEHLDFVALVRRDGQVLRLLWGCAFRV